MSSVTNLVRSSGVNSWIEPRGSPGGLEGEN